MTDVINVDNGLHDTYRKSGLDRLARAFVTSNCILMAKNILIAGSSLMAEYNSILNVLVLFVSMVIYVNAFLRMKNKTKLKLSIVLLAILCIGFWLFTYLFNNKLFTYSFVVDEVETFVIYAVPALVVIPYLEDCTELLKTYYKYRWLLLLVALVSVFLMLFGDGIQGVGNRYAVYSMSFGRALMMPAILFFSMWFQTNKLVDLLGGIVCTLAIFLFASRFPLLCIAVFIIVKIMMSKMSRKMQIFLVIAGIIVIFGLLFFEQIIDWIYNLLLQEFGINSRSLLLMKQGSFTTDAGRGGIYKKLVDKINESPILGYGAAGSIVALDNIQPHSFILDAFGCFGYVFGCVFLLLVGFMLINVYLRNKNNAINKEFIIICMSMFLPICSLQLSIGGAQYFWFLVAIYFSGMKSKGKNRYDS